MNAEDDQGAPSAGPKNRDARPRDQRKRDATMDSQQPDPQLPDPQAVLRDPSLNRQQKIAKLRGWSYDARELEVANEEGMGGPPRPSNLEAIQEALRELGAEDEPASHKQ